MKTQIKLHFFPGARILHDLPGGRHQGAGRSGVLVTTHFIRTPHRAPRGRPGNIPGACGKPKVVTSSGNFCHLSGTFCWAISVTIQLRLNIQLQVNIQINWIIPIRESGRMAIVRHRVPDRVSAADRGPEDRAPPLLQNGGGRRAGARGGKPEPDFFSERGFIPEPDVLYYSQISPREEAPEVIYKLTGFDRRFIVDCPRCRNLRRFSTHTEAMNTAEIGCDSCRSANPERVSKYNLQNSSPE